MVQRERGGGGRFVVEVAPTIDDHAYAVTLSVCVHAETKNVGGEFLPMPSVHYSIPGNLFSHPSQIKLVQMPMPSHHPAGPSFPVQRGVIS